MSSSVMPERALEDDRLQHRGVQAAVGLGLALQRGVGDRLVLQRQPVGLLVEAVHVAQLHAAAAARRLELVARDLLDLEVAHQRVADGLLLGRVVLQAGEQAVGGEHQQPGVRERARGTSARSGARPRRRPPRRTRARSRSGGGRRRSAARRRPAPARSSRRCPSIRHSVFVGALVVVGHGERLARRASSASPGGAAGSANRLKMGERLARVARVRASRSSLGPGWVRSCGRIRPGP